MEIKWYIIGAIVLIVVILIWSQLSSKKDQEERERKIKENEKIIEEKKQQLILELEKKIIDNPQVSIENWEELKVQCITGNVDKVISINKYVDRLIYLYERYKTDENVTNILDGKYTLGMDEHMIREIKGSPNKIDEEVLKTKIKRIYIYGNKSSGDIFTFENGLLVKFIDR